MQVFTTVSSKVLFGLLKNIIIYILAFKNIITEDEVIYTTGKYFNI